jgi:hypothetical protein
MDKENILQVRVNAGTGVLHIQGKGKITSNREYGYANKFQVPTQMTDWLAFLSPTDKSFASESMVYVRGVELIEYSNATVLEVVESTALQHKYITIDKDGNASEGNTFLLQLNTKSPLCVELLDFARQNDLVSTEDIKFTVKDDGTYEFMPVGEEE